MLDHIINEAIAAQIFPGAVIQVASGDHLLHAAAYGNTMYADSGSRPVALDDIYDLASLTKMVTATAALILYDAGELRLERSAAYYLAKLAATEVQVRHLLSHCSGLDLRLAPLCSGGATGLRAAVWAAQPVHPPGSISAYTNINSLLLGEIVAAIAGMPLDHVLSELVLQPLAMTRTCFCPAPELKPQIVPTEWDTTWREMLLHGVVHDESAYALGGVAGHAGLFGPASDLLHFMRPWLEGGAWQGRQFLHEATVALALQDQLAGIISVGGNMLKGGLGWMLERRNFMGSTPPPGSFGHTGFTGTAIIGVPSQNLAMVFLSNRTYPQRTPPPYRHQAVTGEALMAVL
ncbi:serine hydrolase domain-containing protein [Candidatus Viridilinea mediisalina]|nr:serine hydrolase domain-containing protein [Candidatus Viridilinea mediisalina]